MLGGCRSAGLWTILEEVGHRWFELGLNRTGWMIAERCDTGFSLLLFWDGVEALCLVDCMVFESPYTYIYRAVNDLYIEGNLEGEVIS